VIALGLSGFSRSSHRAVIRRVQVRGIASWDTSRTPSGNAGNVSDNRTEDYICSKQNSICGELRYGQQANFFHPLDESGSPIGVRLPLTHAVLVAPNDLLGGPNMKSAQGTLWMLGWLLFSTAGLGASTADGVTIGHRFQIQSEILGEDREFLVHTPIGYQYNPKRYPVLVVLDAEDNFVHTSAAVDVLSRNERIPQLIVVGINNTDRMRDLTTPSSDPMQSASGGAAKFLSFIADELLPQIDRTYPTRPYRILIGHSLGGLFAVNALVTQPEVFNAYLAISPSLWWEDQSVVTAAKSFFESRKDLKGDLYMAIGDEGGEMLGGAWRLSAIMEEHRTPEFRWQFKRSEAESHGTIPYLSTYEGLQALFEGYSLERSKNSLSSADAKDIEDHYARVSQRLGYEVPVPSTAWLVAAFSGPRDLERIGSLLRRAHELAPKDPQRLLWLAEYSAEIKDEERGVDYLKQALAIAPGNPDARRLLELFPGRIAAPQDLELPAKELAKYVGTYRSGDDPQKMTLENGRLFISDPYGRCELHALTRDHFYCAHSDTQLLFHRNSSGRIKSVKMQFPEFSYERVRE
jgi:predicted alpha/beta superfamily hydrolase